ncbi:MAG: bifunctional folylpolyglutamate synthase/dihydrofolate synthase [Verrucomicrobia subdivision 3 bacterium]|nr:bifunctional folylpolyglutamate synthase/dihydrofolate synthase [Limisphaerales bacterium]
MTYQEAIDWLYELRLLGSKLGLENPRQLAAHAGNPHEQLRIIHVAGTNGKGSVCAMLESIYHTAGYKTGLFTSPHLVSFRERIQVNREPIAEAEVVRLTECIQALLRHFPAGQPPTFFEVITVMALEHFAREQCDVVLLETGLGGRLDATNIVTPIATVITPIALDHQQYLGETLAQIAAEKAGILKKGIPALSAPQPPEARDVLKQTGPITFVDTEHPTALAGQHQRQNAALAAATIEAVQNTLTVKTDSIKTALGNVHWPARGQVFERAGCKLLLDAVHNPAGAEALRGVLAELHSGQRPTLMLGVLADKNWERMVGILAPLAGRIVCVPVSSERTLPPDELAEACRQQNDCEVIIAESLENGLSAVGKDDFVVITGSIYLLGEAMNLLGLAVAGEEKDLNEWKMLQP